MFLFQEFLKVNNRRQSELVQRQNWIHGLMKPNKGFAGADLARYMGNATDYLVLRKWDSEADFLAFRQTPDGQNYPKSRPEGLFEGLPAGRRYDCVIDSKSNAKGGFLVRSTYAVPEGREDEFVANRQRHDGLAQQVPGTVYLQTFRCLDEEGDSKGTFLCIARRTDRDAYNSYLESAQAEEYRKGNVRGLYKTLATELFELVDEVEPGS
jgi:heme-degrading monooxygenase HmoA